MDRAHIQPQLLLEIRLMVSLSYNKRTNKMIMVDVQLVLLEIIFQNKQLEGKREKSSMTEEIKISKYK